MGAESQVIFFTEVLDFFFHRGYLEVLLNNYFGTNHGALTVILRTGNVQSFQCWRCLLFPIPGIRIARLVLELPYISAVCCQLTVENYGIGSNTFV
jgi:hypothetical protein